MFAFRGDTVLDPFMGSGTTSLAAKNLERNSVGYEINPEFIEIAKQKLNTRQPDFMGTEYEFPHDMVNGDVAVAIDQLPWQFKHPFTRIGIDGEVAEHSTISLSKCQM